MLFWNWTSCASAGPLNIPVVVDLPGVGQNLQDHPLAVVGYQSQDLPLAPSSNGRGWVVVAYPQ